MLTADGFLREIEKISEKRKQEILEATDSLVIKGRIFYVSSSGNDENDGLSPERPWQTLKKVSDAPLGEGDGVLFCRGDLFRGYIKAKSGVSYGAYGVGEKPKLYGWDRSLADESLWELVDSERHFWRLTEPILDCGTLVFNGGERWCRKLIPSYRDSKFVCREDESREFDMRAEMTQDLDMVCFYTERLTEKESKGESFPVPIIDEDSLGELYLRCDGGNPASVFKDIEALPKRNMFKIGSNDNISIDNLCLKYIGAHAIGAGGQSVKGLHVTNCEIGWVGGSIQNYLGTDPNYVQGRRGSVTRYGNGVEIYGGCEDYLVSNCYIYQVYDAGITHQITTNGRYFELKGIRYTNNLVEKCVYSIEYFLEKNKGDRESYISDCEISRNILRLSGYGWGQQRHNTDTPAHIKGWSYENTARDFLIENNIFDRAAYRMLHLVAKEIESCPRLSGNTYVQVLGHTLGQYGANAEEEPEIMSFDESAETTIRDFLGDKAAKVFFVR